LSSLAEFSEGFVGLAGRSGSLLCQERRCKGFALPFEGSTNLRASLRSLAREELLELLPERKFRCNLLRL